jgi:hypothetical protein
MRTHEIEKTLRELDPATGDGPGSEETLARILRAPRAGRADRAARAESATPAPARTRRPLRIGLAASAVTAALVIGGVLGVDALRPEPAEASWSPVGTTVGAEDPATTACDASADDMPGLRLVLAERRGGTTLSWSEGEGGASLMCLARGDEVLGSIASTGVGADGAASGAAPLAAGAVDGGILGGVFEGGPDTGEPEGGGDAHVMARGRVGEDVTGIELTAPGEDPIDATVGNGRYLAWWPTDRGPGESVTITARITTADGDVHEQVLEDD